MTAPPVLAEVVRGGLVEGHHRGHVVVTGPDGTVEWSAGTVDRPMYPRSCVKPMQAAALLGAGLTLSGELLALAASSHSGEPFHLDGVRAVLAGAGLEVTALGTPAAHPIDERARDERLRAGLGPEPLTMNCSGKHAAMLATCTVNGWPTVGYLDPDHPVQRAVRAGVQDAVGEVAAGVAVDGCGAPLLAMSLTALARGFGRFAAAGPGTPAGRVAAAVRAHPEWASGTRREEAALIRAVPGLLGKGGAEAVYAVGLPDGRGVAVKIDDGGSRARSVVMSAVLRRLGIHHPTLDAQGLRPVLGGGRPVGEIRPAGPLTRA